MDKFLIDGPSKIKGKVSISGSKNASLPILAATLLFDLPVTIKNLPRVKDISTMLNLLKSLGSKIKLSKDKKTAKIFNNKNMKTFASYSLVKTMRGSILVLGPLVAKYHKSKTSLPGGCLIGARPVNYHLSALEKLGMNYEIKDGYILAKSFGKLKGGLIRFPKITVGATENSIIAACLAKGKTVLNTWLDENNEVLEVNSKDQILNELLLDMKLPNIETLYQSLGNGNTGINIVGNKIRKIVFPNEISVDDDLYSPEIKNDSKSDLIIVEGYDDIQVRMAKCCVPVPGDDILGFITISNGIAIHRSDCLNIKIDPNKGERILDVSWGFEPNSGTIVWLEIEAIDRPYLLRDATIAISDNGGNILVAKSVTSSKRIVSLIFQIEISDVTQLDAILNDAKDIENVFEATRIYPGRNCLI